MKYKYGYLILAMAMTACSTLDQSLKLGGTMGALFGGAATFGAYSAGGQSPSLQTVTAGAAIGTAIGFLTSYLTHQSVALDRKSCDVEQTEMHFGDLPPSPFIVPKPNAKKGVK